MTFAVDDKSGLTARRWIPALLFFLGIVVFLPSIWSETGPTEKDECILSFRTPMEMHEHGQWLTPWLDDQPRLRKPPLLYWAIMFTYKTFGIHLWCARIWGVLAGAGMGVCACLFARELSRSDGLLAGLLTLGSIGVAVEARQAMLDLPLGLFAGLSVLFWVRWLRRERWRDILYSAVTVGLAFLIKGPVGLFFFLTGALSALWVFGAWQVPSRRMVHVVVWLLLTAAISLPWPLLMKHIWGDHFAEVVGREMANRHFVEMYAMRPFAALTGALGLIFPWTPLVIGAIAGFLRQPRNERQRETKWLVAWFFLSILPFLFMKSSERYMLAISPIQATLGALWLEGGSSAGRIFTVRLSVSLLAILLALLCIFIIWFKLGVVEPTLCLLVAGCICWQTFRDMSHVRIAAAVMVALAICLGFVYPKLGINAMPQDLQHKFAGLTARQFDTTQPALLSMRLGYSVQKFDSGRLVAAKSAQAATEVVFFVGFEREEFTKMAEENSFQVEELGCFKTIGSHKTLIPFARWNRVRPDWPAAIRTRSLETFKIEICYCRVTAPMAR